MEPSLRYHVGTSQLIWMENRLTDFYRMMENTQILSKWGVIRFNEISFSHAFYLGNSTIVVHKDFSFYLIEAVNVTYCDHIKINIYGKWCAIYGTIRKTVR